MPLNAAVKKKNTVLFSLAGKSVWRFNRDYYFVVDYYCVLFAVWRGCHAVRAGRMLYRRGGFSSARICRVFVGVLHVFTGVNVRFGKEFFI